MGSNNIEAKCPECKHVFMVSTSTGIAAVDACRTCGGKGNIEQSHMGSSLGWRTCPKCDGTGEYQPERFFF